MGLKTHPEDICALHAEFRDLFLPVVANDRIDAMIERAIALREARRKALLRETRNKYFDDMTRAMGAELVEDVKAIEREILQRSKQCPGCGTPEGSFHGAECPVIKPKVRVWVDEAASVSPQITMPVDAWAEEYVAALPPIAEPELTPAERTWRAHKGFTR